MIRELIYNVPRPGYWIDELGQVYSSKRGPRKPLTPYIDEQRYVRFGLWDGRRLTTIQAHRAVLFTFVGFPPTIDCHAGHRDDNPANNHVSNLEWQTPMANIHQQINRRRHVHGTTTHTNKLTETQVRAIAEDMRGLQVIATEYGITFGQVWKIRHHLSWRHLWVPATHSII